MWTMLSQKLFQTHVPPPPLPPSSIISSSLSDFLKTLTASLPSLPSVSLLPVSISSLPSISLPFPLLLDILSLKTLFDFAACCLLYTSLRLFLLRMLIRFDSTLLKLSAILFPSVGTAFKKMQEEESFNRKKNLAKSPNAYGNYNAKRNSIFMTPNISSKLLSTLSEDSNSPTSPPLSPFPSPSVFLPPLPYFESFLDPLLLLSLLSPPLPLLLPTLLPNLLPLRLLHPLFLHTSELIHDLFLLTGTETDSVNYTFLNRMFKFIIILTGLRHVLIFIGLKDLGTSILNGFGYGSLLVGWGLKELVVDLIAGLSLFFGRVVREGTKVEVWGRQADVVKCGVRSVVVRLIRDGEMLVVPNSKLVHEVVTTYEEWEERRSQLNFTIDSKATVQQVKSIKVKFKNLIDEAEGIRGSTPTIYLVGMTNGWQFECVWYVLDYNDNIAIFKAAMDKVVEGTIQILEEESCTVVHFLPAMP
ncbi:hypothetical protein TrVE_jg11645 [Triparma verrucosa]|uniref:Mechanosensitive ion channel MscS domain-containing protein n=1 Tax=Triparma verrucosa TaxID=1606542 RepID=A0A9W6Z4S1_9STRA|nr:hypothetical protein TrVE_jg11645 [Triparma verrucosa]